MRQFLANTKLVYLTAAIFFILLILLVKLQADQIQKKQKIKAEISSLENQYNELNNKTNQLKDSLSYLSSPQYKEFVARQQLNLKKEGEAVYTFQEIAKLDQATTPDQGSSKENPVDNLKNWWLYFFKTNEN